MQKVAQYTGWTLIVAGVHVALYLVYILAFTGLETARAQADLLEAWELEVGDIRVDVDGPTTLPGQDVEIDVLPAAAGGDAVALLKFEPPTDGRDAVHDDILAVVEGVSLADLRLGPGHYSKTGGPGTERNFAISGHRTTYSQPFYNLERLVPGDVAKVVDREGTVWTYRVVEAPDRCAGTLEATTAACIVRPTDVWVIGRDPLGDGQPLMTITTCHPRFSAAQRLVVFLELVTA